MQKKKIEITEEEFKELKDAKKKTIMDYLKENHKDWIYGYGVYSYGLLEENDKFYVVCTIGDSYD